MNNKYMSQDGYTFIKGKQIVGKVLYLGKYDNIANYIQVEDSKLSTELEQEDLEFEQK